MSTSAGTWLVPPGRRALTPHRNPARAGGWPLDLVVIHYTATPYSSARRATRGSDAARQLSWLRGERGATSTHLDVLRDGVALQGAPLEDRTWHCGGSVWVSPEGRRTTTPNRASIGLDLDNVGRLYLVGQVLVDAYERARVHTSPGATAPNYRRAPVLTPRSFDGPIWQAPDGTWWEAYTVPQVRTTLRLVAELRDLYPRLGDARRWVGHEHIRATKMDPGPAFPWGVLRAVVERRDITPADAEGMALAHIPGLVE